MSVAVNLSSVKTRIKALQSRVYQEISPRLQREVADRFLRFYFDEGYQVDNGKTWKDTYWMGIPIRKCPFDLWLYQEILFELKPDVIIECGTAFGGSALYLASLCDLFKQGKVITIDTDDSYTTRQEHPRITYLSGSSTAKEIVAQVEKLIADKQCVLVILDSDHSKAHVLEEIRIYNRMVTPGSYLIVEDGIVNGHPVLPDFGPGPLEAIEEFMQENHDFELDKSKEKFHMSFNPKGYLKKLK